MGHIWSLQVPDTEHEEGAEIGVSLGESIA